MKKVIYKNYGSPDVLQIVETEQPVPADNEILIKIHATTVTATECKFRQGKPFITRLFTGITKPKIQTLGEEIAGEVVTAGKDVSKFKTGDKVFGTAGPEFGANAEYICLPENGVLSVMPDNLNYGEAASCVDGFLTALPFLKEKGNIEKEQEVLIYGASGSIGSSAVQVAKYFGTEVTGVCSTSNIELVKSLGAEHVFDYTKEDFTKSGKKFDIIFDTVRKISFLKVKSSLKTNGIFLESGIGLGIMPFVLWTSFFGNRKVKIAATGLRPPEQRRNDLILLKELLGKSKIKPVIDSAYTLDQISEAHRYVDKGHKKGNVVIKITE